MIHIPVTLFTSAVLGILCAVLSIMVSAARTRTKVMIGDGGGAAGMEGLLHAVRAHGNFIEHVPLALILLGGIEVSGASHLTCDIFAGLLILSRLMHATGIYRPAPNVLRAGGAMLTWLVLLGLGVEALILVV
jgi:uncharacterized protein